MVIPGPCSGRRAELPELLSDAGFSDVYAYGDEEGECERMVGGV